MRASDRAYETLRDEIQSGSLAAGSVLAEPEQAARLGVSRTPVREAIDRLLADGLAVRQSPRVTVVSSLGADQIRALFQVRRALEETTARLAAQSPDRPDFTADFAAVDPTGDAYYPLIARFDQAIDAAADNAYLAHALRPVRTHLVRARRLARDDDARLKASLAEHRLIAQAIAAGDGDLAAHATHVHLHNALTYILGLVSEGSR